MSRSSTSAMAPAARRSGPTLAFATPRPWLDDGKSIRVVRAPTGWGPVSYGIRRHGNAVRIVLDVPPAPELRLRLRLPRHRRLARVDLSGRPLRFDATSGTIRLPAGVRGTLRIVAGLEAAPVPVPVARKRR